MTCAICGMESAIEYDAVTGDKREVEQHAPLCGKLSDAYEEIRKLRDTIEQMMPMRDIPVANPLEERLKDAEKVIDLIIGNPDCAYISCTYRSKYPKGGE